MRYCYSSKKCFTNIPQSVRDLNLSPAYIVSDSFTCIKMCHLCKTKILVSAEINSILHYSCCVGINFVLLLNFIVGYEKEWAWL